MAATTKAELAALVTRLQESRDRSKAKNVTLAKSLGRAKAKNVALGKGSTFSFTLPIERPAEAVARDAPAPTERPMSC